MKFIKRKDILTFNSFTIDLSYSFGGGSGSSDSSSDSGGTSDR